jgi:hypothetical protein
MWLTGGVARVALGTLLLAAACLAVPVAVTARDVCPTVMPASALPDPSTAVEIDAGEPLGAVLDRLVELEATIDDRSQVSRIRQIPDPLPVDPSVVWVWQFGYLVDPEYPGDPDEQIAPRFEAILCLGTRVPESVGESAAGAVDALESRSLVPVAADDGDRSVVGLQPEPGELVQFGTAVEVATAPVVVSPEVTAPTSDEQPRTDQPARPAPEPAPSTAQPARPAPEPVPSTAQPRVDRLDGDRDVRAWPEWPWLAPIVAVAAAAGVWIWRRRSHHGRARTPDHDPMVTTRVHEGQPQTGIIELPGVGTSHTVRIQAHHDDPDVTVTPTHLAGAPVRDIPDGSSRR